jgi:uncharacterized protein (TIGR03083 family)
MNQPIVSSTVFAQEHRPMKASTVAKISPAEVIPLAREELTRFLSVIESLMPADWDKATECTLWTVKDVVAHQASHVVGLTQVRQLLDQFNPLKFRAYSQRGMNYLDAANQLQVDNRANWTPAQVIAEIRDNREASLLGRQSFPSLLRRMPLVTPGYEGWQSMGELMDTIFTRDMWMHRLDICHATGAEMTQTADHDGRITALVIRDLDTYLTKKLNGSSLIYRLTGTAGGVWTVGGSSSPTAEVTFDMFDFHRLASGRITHQQALQQGLVRMDGDHSLGNRALQHTVVLY